MAVTESGSLGRGAWDSKGEDERPNPSAQEASDGLDLQRALSRKTCLEAGEGWN